MGLDNGITLIITPEIANSKMFKRFFGKKELYYSYTFETHTVDICYWRKCWGIRDDIIRHLELPTDGGRHFLTISNIEDIIDILGSYNRDNWNAIWDWDEPRKDSRKKRLKQEQKELRKLIKLMKKCEAVVYFYDSY